MTDKDPEYKPRLEIRITERIRRFFGAWPRCPKCRRKFSDWFVWPTGKGLLRYCYPCYEWDRFLSDKLDNGLVITEENI